VIELKRAFQVEKYIRKEINQKNMKWTEREVCSIFRGSEIEGRLWKEDR
jgi:hypothetical protein